MVRKCSIPGCKTGYASERKKLKGKKAYSLFRACTADQLENWRKVIPRADRLITSRDRVCELHFTEEDIDRYFETTLYDGNVFKLEREIPQLRKGAIPTKFPNLPRYSSNISKIVEKMKSPSNYVPVTKKKHRTQESTNSKSTELEESEFGESFAASEAIKDFSFSELVKKLESVSKPNASWGITAHDSFIMCAKWSEDHTLKRRVVIDLDLKIKVYLEAGEFCFESDVSSIEEISFLLESVDCFQLM